MNRDELRAHRDVAPLDAEACLAHYANVGQLFGWITQTDARFLITWLPHVARDYPVQAMRIVEVGTFAGSTARGLAVLSGGGQVTCIDNFTDANEGTLNGHPNGRSYWEWTLSQHPSLLEHCTLIEGDSAAIGAGWRDPIDLLLVDGDHSYAAALADLRLFGKHVVPGGYLLVDDVHMPEVARAVRQFTSEFPVWGPVRAALDAEAKLLVLRRAGA